jgi:predicted Zn-dependent peptidase
MLHEAAYGEDSPLGASKYAVTLDKLSVMDIMAYRKANYDVTSMTVSSSGGVPLAQVRA